MKNNDKNSVSLFARYKKIKPLETDYESNWRKFEFWRNSFFVFWIFSLIGHYLEYVWGALPVLIGGEMRVMHIPFFAVAAPYGLGALALIWTVYPFVKKGKVGIIGSYVLSVIVATAIEFICALLIVIVLGNNPFWDYSDTQFNLFGFVCLPNSLAFGVVAVPMLYFIFPYFNNLLNKIKSRYLNIAFWILSTSYFAIQICQIWLWNNM